MRTSRSGTAGTRVTARVCHLRIVRRRHDLAQQRPAARLRPGLLRQRDDGIRPGWSRICVRLVRRPAVPSAARRGPPVAQPRWRTHHRASRQGRKGIPRPPRAGGRPVRWTSAPDPLPGRRGTARRRQYRQGHHFTRPRRFRWSGSGLGARHVITGSRRSRFSTSSDSSCPAATPRVRSNTSSSDRARR